MKKQLLFGAALSLGTASFIGANAFAADMSNILTEGELKTCLEQTVASTCTINSDIALTSPIIVTGDDITLDTGTFTISASDDFTNKTGALITVNHGGTLTIEGSGTITSIAPTVSQSTYGTIRMTGKGDINDTESANLIINGGTIIGDYYAIVGNGSLGRGNTNITINDGLIKGVREENGLAIYHPQSGTLTVNGGTLTGDTGVAFKSGTLNLNGGSIVATGADNSPVAGHSDGLEASGAALQIESNKGYLGTISLNFNGGTLKSENGIAFYEYVEENTVGTHIDSVQFNAVSIFGKKAAFLISSELDGTVIWKKNLGPKAVITEGSFTGKTLKIEKSATVTGLPVGVTTRIDGTYEIDDDERAAIAALGIAGFTPASTYGITLSDDEANPITELEESASFTLPLPTNLPALADGYTRAYYVIRIHNGEATKLSSVTNADGTISFDSSLFSTFVIGYVDTKSPEIPAAPNSGFMDTTTDSVASSIMPLVAVVVVATSVFASVKLLKNQH